MFKRNKKAFTLVELLAVIVVLAIILIIAVPRVLHVIEESDKEAFRITGEQLIKGAEDRQVYETMGSLEEKTYIIEDGTFVGDSIPMNGELPEEGIVKITSEGTTSMAVSDDTWCATKYEDEEKVIVSKDPDCRLFIPEVVADSCFFRTQSAGSITITGYNNTCSKNLIIPDTLDGFPVRILGNSSFTAKNITSVKFPNTLTTIGNDVFYTNLIRKLDITSSVTSIGDFAFQNNMIKDLTIPNSVTYLGRGVFNTNLLPDNQANIYARNPDGTENYSRLVSYGGARRYKIITPLTVTTIGEYAYDENRITSITLHNNITSIEQYAFKDNNFLEINIPTSISALTTGVFYRGFLKNVIIPNNIITIGTGAFRENKIETLTLSNNLTTIGNYGFYCNNIQSLIIPNSVRTIGTYAFMGNEMEWLTLSNSLTSMGIYAFAYNQIPDVIIPGTLLNIPNYAFRFNPLKTLSLENGIRTIGTNAFEMHYVADIIFPPSLISIGNNAFSTINSLPAPDGSRSGGMCLCCVCGDSHCQVYKYPASLYNITLSQNLIITPTSISQSFYDSYVTENSSASGVYTSISQYSPWTKQP